MFNNNALKTRSIIMAAIMMIVSLGYGCVAYYAGARNVAQYENSVSGTQRSPEDMRGLINNMLRFRTDFVPAFLPQHLWGEEYCAATLVTAVNFITGKATLVDSSSWEFSQKNGGRIKRIYSRPEDFKWETGSDGSHRLKEVYDRPIRLSQILPVVNGTTDRLYVVGYHYSQTRNDEKLWEAKKDLNTHVMLLLGRHDGSWYGYHMLHDMKDDTTYPFRIETLSDDMSKWFDIVYIWEVNGTTLASGTGSPIAFVQDLSPYTTVKTVNMLPGLKKVNVVLFGDEDQFPHVQREVHGVYPVARYRSSYEPGTVLGFVGRTAVKYHTGKTDPEDRSEYGLNGQCVEFANRYLVFEQGHRNLVRTGDAKYYFSLAEDHGLTAYQNSWAKEGPAVGDLLVFSDNDDRGPGHVAVVTAASDTEVCIAQQNAHPWNLCLPMYLTGSANGIAVKVDTAQLGSELHCMGWSRITRTPIVQVQAPAPTPTAVPAAPQPVLPVPPAQPATYVIKVQKVRRGLRNTVRAVVHRTAGADLQASFTCNKWDFSQEARHKIYPGQTWKVCGWKK